MQQRHGPLGVIALVCHSNMCLVSNFTSPLHRDARALVPFYFVIVWFWRWPSMMAFSVLDGRIAVSAFDASGW